MPALAQRHQRFEDAHPVVGQAERVVLVLEEPLGRVQVEAVGRAPGGARDGPGARFALGGLRRIGQRAEDLAPDGGPGAAAYRADAEQVVQDPAELEPHHLRLAAGPLVLHQGPGLLGDLLEGAVGYPPRLRVRVDVEHRLVRARLRIRPCRPRHQCTSAVPAAVGIAAGNCTVVVLVIVV